MKIVIDARESGTSTGRYIDKLVENLQKIDRINQYIVLYLPHRFNEVTLSADNFIKVKTRYKEFTFGEQIGFVRQLYGLKADLVHFGMIQQPILYFKKSITTMHDLTTVRFRNPAKSRIHYWLRLPPYWLVIQLVARRAKAIITPSTYVLEDVRKFTKHRPKNGVVTHESADVIADKSEPIAELQGKQFIMYVGRPTPHKNLERLIDAFAIIQKNIPELRLVLAGKKDPLMEGHESYAKDKSIKNVTVTGFVSEGQLRWLYENTACYTFPSLSEGFGLPGLEAMKHGAPVASSKATCLPEIYGDAATYFSPYSSIEMAQVIEDVIVHKKLKASLIAKGKKQAAKYSWQRMAEQTLAVYKKSTNRGQ